MHSHRNNFPRLVERGTVGDKLQVQPNLAETRQDRDGAVVAPQKSIAETVQVPRSIQFILRSMTFRGSTAAKSIWQRIHSTDLRSSSKMRIGDRRTKRGHPNSRRLPPQQSMRRPTRSEAAAGCVPTAVGDRKGSWNRPIVARREVP